jgi:hypothetical protein
MAKSPPPPTSPRGLPSDVDIPALQAIASTLTPDQLMALANAASTQSRTGIGADAKVKSSLMGAAMLGGMVGAKGRDGKNNSKAGESGPTETSRLIDQSKDFASAAYRASGFDSVVQKVKTGNVPLRLAATLGGIAMVISGVLTFLGDAFSLLFVNAIIQLYIVAFGIIVCILEIRNEKSREAWLPLITQYAFFLTQVWGRGAFYFFAGTLALSQWTLMSILVGLYMMAMGSGMIWYGKRAVDRLHALHDQILDKDKLEASFREHDRDNNGGLDPHELALLCAAMGTGLSRSEIEAAILMLDANDDGLIQYDEFYEWWKCFNEAKLGSVEADVKLNSIL